MGYELAIALIVGVILYAAMYYYYGSGDTEMDEMNPAGIDEFQMTQSNEGTSVTLVYGRKRTNGNVLWYGNLETEPVWSGGGGSDDPDPVIVGYKYYLDVWQAVCLGPADLISYYVDNDDEVGITATSEVWNDGTTGTFPTEPGQYAAPLEGIAHIFWNRWLVGENRTRLPTVHFIVERFPTGTGLTYVEETNGCNPAVIIYDLLLRAGAVHADIHQASFAAANIYWHNQGYGLNISFSKQMTCRAAVAKVLKYIGGVFSLTSENEFYLKALDPSEAKVATITTKEFLSFSFARKSWTDTKNDFRANFVDETQDYTKRTVALRNMANMWLTGQKKLTSIDLTGFRNVDTVSKRLWEVMKTQSYPAAEFDFMTNLKYAARNVGDVVELVNEDYGITSAYVRIMAKDVKEYDQNKVGFKATQVVERLFDTNYIDAGNVLWTKPDLTLAAIPSAKQRVYELPWMNSTLAAGPTYLMLAERPHLWETSFVVIISFTGSDYNTLQVAHRWAQYGLLSETYIATTLDIDDDIGILYTPSKEDPSFDTITRTDLFAKTRLALVEDELMAFQTVTPEGGTDIRLTGVIRGLFNTDVVQHNSGVPIWLFEYPSINSRTTMQEQAGTFYLKFLPSIAGVVLDASDATAITVNRANAAEPYRPTRVHAVRSGSTVTINWWPTTQYWDGAGAVPADSQLDVYPFNFNGSFEYYNSVDGIGAAEIAEVTVKVVSKAAAFTFYVRHIRVDGQRSDWSSVLVSAPDATYVGPDE